MSKLTTTSLLLAIIFLGMFFRFYRIAEIPPGLYPDEAMNGNNALEAIQTAPPAGGFKVFYPENNGREGLFINLQALSVRFFGNEPWALRIVSAIFGTLTILGVYLLAKELFEKQESRSKNQEELSSLNSKFLILNSETAALLSSLFLAVSYWHINFSRIGFRAIMVPFFTTFALYFLLKGMRKGTALDMVFAGIFTGLGFYTYLAFRFFPFVLLVPIGWYLWKWYKQKQEARITNQGTGLDSKFLILNSNHCFPCLLALFLFITLVVSLPLGIYFFQHPEDFFGRTSQVSVFSAEYPLFEFAKSNLLTLQMFFYQGDCNWRHNYNCQPELHPIVALFFLIGLFASIAAIIQKLKIKNQNDNLKFKNNPDSSRDTKILSFAFYILISWGVFMSLPATLTREGLPHSLRSIGLIPPVMILAGFGAYITLDSARQWLERQKSRWPDAARKITRIQKEMVILLVAVLLILPVSSYRDYFIRWAYHPKTYFGFSTDVWHLGKFLDSLPDETRKYVVVDRSLADLRQVGTSAQTVMFATGTFLEKNRREKNIEYLPPDEIEKITIEGKTTVAILADNQRELIRYIRRKFPSLKPKVPGDFVILEN